MRLASELTNLRPQIMTIIDASIDARRDLQATLHVSRVFELERTDPRTSCNFFLIFKNTCPLNF